jgi:glucosamine--fructose-6-phosphate aminotransferase (isomerizing)
VIKRFIQIGAYFLRSAAALQVRIGIDPRRAPAGSIILFPCYSARFHCGLAGIMAVNRPGGKASFDAGDMLTRCYEKIKGKGLAALLSNQQKPADYLDGSQCLENTEKALELLKQNENFDALFFDTNQTAHLWTIQKQMKAFHSGEEKTLEETAGQFSTGDLETINSRLVRLKDIIWALEKDILDNQDRIVKLAGASSPSDLTPAALAKYRDINFLLNCIDRLEVRGRDSAGIQILFQAKNGRALDSVLENLKSSGHYNDFSKRSQSGDLFDGKIHISRTGNTAAGADSDQPISLSFTYKTFSIIGELGQNVRTLRNTIENDHIFKAFAAQETVFLTTFAHTRWASVGSITEENCHPVNNYTLRDAGRPMARTISVVLNGDIDNYLALKDNLEAGQGELIASELTTDTKIIPLQIEKHLAEGHDLTTAFRLAVRDFEGSHAIAMISDLEPGKAFLALKGSGQTIYVGMAPDRYIFSSELYGLVEGTPYFLKMDGEKTSLPNDEGAAGQVFVLKQDSEGGIAGISAFFYDGTPIAIGDNDIKRAEITTRDIDRGEYGHFFMKEINESTLSVRKTLRGKYRITEREGGGHAVSFNLGADIFPDKITRAIRDKAIRHITVIGHGTAAVAGSAVADAFARYLKNSRITVEAKVASEMSGFHLEEDLADTLVIPITQSGTTTDTNRAVAMAAERGAMIISIVNRRQSDITTKSNGVFYTSDGRDIEMSVASTKAFYSQIVAGHILALSFAKLMGTMSDNMIADELMNLEHIPAAMLAVLAQKDKIRASVTGLSKKKRYWAIVGSGPNKSAADEIRIKLSELCYKTISSDIIENKKHIDLSAEPLIIVCAAGSPEAVIGDIVKDVAIFKAHKAGVVVFADEGDNRFANIADSVIGIPGGGHPAPVILNTLAGHLWGYYAACHIDEDATFLREFRGHLNLRMQEQAKHNFNLYEKVNDAYLRRLVADFANRFYERRNEGGFIFTSVKALSDLVLLLKYSIGKLPLEDFWHDFNAKDDMPSPIAFLDISLGQLIDELSRPVDAIRHQAKTVTVGTSRKEEQLKGITFDLLRTLGFTAKSMISKNIPAIIRIQPAIAAINGYTLYDINNLDADGAPGENSTISIRERQGIARLMTSRTEQSNLLMGTKKTIVRTANIYIGQGKYDAASIVIIPMLGEGIGVKNLLLIHVTFNETLPMEAKRGVLGTRYNDIRNLINEYNLPWDDSYLEKIPLKVLLGDQVEVIARQIKDNL